MLPDRLDISRFIPTSRLSLLRQVAGLSAELGSSAYLVGGFVRDALLKRPINDFDIVIEGDATKLARALVKKFGGRVTVHAPFKTATWFLPSNLTPDTSTPDTLDLISARSETYEYPAALPTVKLGSLDDDLRRRDFTINAMAVCLDKERFGELTDPLGGRADLERKLVRVLHPNSFVDDPTRLFRAVRYAARYEFQIESSTEALIPAALPYVDKLSPERLRHELDLIFDEEDSAPMMEKLWAPGIVQAVRPALPSDEATRGRFQRVSSLPSSVGNPVHFRWAVWLLGLSGKEIRALSKRLHFTAELTKTIAAASSVFADLDSIASLRPSGCVRRLDGLPDDGILAASVCAQGEAHTKLEMYLSKWKQLRPFTNGETLEKMGVPFGPRRGEILWRLRAAWVDGEIKTETGEKKMLEQMLK